MIDRKLSLFWVRKQKSKFWTKSTCTDTWMARSAAPLKRQNTTVKRLFWNRLKTILKSELWLFLEEVALDCNANEDIKYNF